MYMVWHCLGVGYADPGMREMGSVRRGPLAFPSGSVPLKHIHVLFQDLVKKVLSGHSMGFPEDGLDNYSTETPGLVGSTWSSRAPVPTFHKRCWYL